ncbi:unnamed protein product, partial [Didymodactylos carnosus]
MRIKPRTNMLSVRIVITDHYLAEANPEFDPKQSELLRHDVKRVPVIRIFGPNQDGKKVCLHLHGVFPYLLIKCTNDDIRYAHQLAHSLDKAINLSYGNGDSQAQHVHDIDLIQLLPIYGYHEKKETFWKIYFYNPQVIRKASDLLLGGAVMNQSFQPHEAHVPLNLQFFIDYNLYGMNFILFRYGKLRKSSQTRQGISNPGLQALWDGERSRRQKEKLHQPLTPPTSPERPNANPFDAEIKNREKLKVFVSKRAKKPLILSNEQESTVKIDRDEATATVDIVQIQRINSNSQHAALLADENSPQNADIDRLADLLADLDDSQAVENDSILAVNTKTIEHIADEDELIDDEQPQRSLSSRSTTLKRKLSNEDTVEPPYIPAIAEVLNGDVDYKLSDDILVQQITVDGTNGSDKMEEERIKNQKIALEKFFVNGQETKVDYCWLETCQRPPKKKLSAYSRKKATNIVCQDIEDETERVKMFSAIPEYVSKHSHCHFDSTESNNAYTMPHNDRITQWYEPLLQPPHPKYYRQMNIKNKIDLNNASLLNENNTQILDDSWNDISFALETQDKDSDSGQSFSQQKKLNTSLSSTSQRYRRSSSTTSVQQQKTGVHQPRCFRSLLSERIQKHRKKKSLKRSRKQIQTNLESSYLSLTCSLPLRNEPKSRTNLFHKQSTITNAFLRKFAAKPICSRNLSVIDQATLNNSHGFRIDQFNMDDLLHECQYLTILSFELLCKTEEQFAYLLEKDEICCIFFTVSNETMSGWQCETCALICDKYFYHDDPVSILKTFNQDKHSIELFSNEKDLILKFITIVEQYDPDILTCYDIKLGLNYLIKRAYQKYNFDLLSQLSRIPKQKENSHRIRTQMQADGTELPVIAGRILLDLWKILRSEVTLNVYTFENVVYHVLHERIPKYNLDLLSKWFTGQNNTNDRFIESYGLRNISCLLDYFWTRTVGNFRLLYQLDLLNKTSEFARVYGIEFYQVLSRGSQYRVESMMIRLAKCLSYVTVTPDNYQRLHMRAPECIPLTLEPLSNIYFSPIAVLDFQSLYPSIIIAYNLCFSTCLGRIDQLNKQGPFKFGCTSLTISDEILDKIDFDNDLFCSPNGCAFVLPHIRRGILPIMLEEILSTRVMIKSTMKLIKQNSTLYRILDARQLCLKLIANVTFGYTSANYSGRMPAVELGDTIVHTARTVLGRAIDFVKTNPKFGGRVVYGDT